MQELAIKIGSAVIDFFMNMDWDGIVNALYIMGIGMLGIFVVTGIIILCTSLLKLAFSKAK